MAKLTSDQALALARAFRDLSVAVGDYQFQNFEDLTQSQRRRLEDLEFDIRNDSTRLNAMSISLALDDLEDTLSRIDHSTTRMLRAIRKLDDLRRVINIATAAVTLGAAIVSGSPSAVLAALDGANEAVG